MQTLLLKQTKIYVNFMLLNRMKVYLIYFWWDVVSIQVLQIDDVTIKISALKAIFDQLMTFGFEPFKTKKIKATQKEGAEVNSNEEQSQKNLKKKRQLQPRMF